MIDDRPVIVVAGGYNKDGVEASTEILDQLTRTWNLYDNGDNENTTSSDMRDNGLPHMRRSAQILTDSSATGTTALRPRSTLVFFCEEQEYGLDGGREKKMKESRCSYPLFC